MAFYIQLQSGTGVIVLQSGTGNILIQSDGVTPPSALPLVLMAPQLPPQKFKQQ